MAASLLLRWFYILVFVLDDMVVNSSEIVGGLIDDIVPALLERAGPLIMIFKAVGIVLMVYIVYLIYRSIVRIKDRRRMKRIEKKVFDIDAKLSKLIGKKRK